MNAETPESPRELRCPLGTACDLRIVNLHQWFCECTPHDAGHHCPQALNFGGTTFCRALWKQDAET